MATSGKIHSCGYLFVSIPEEAGFTDFFLEKLMLTSNNYCIIVEKQVFDLVLLILKSMLTFLLQAEDYQELTQREENDLEYMISQTENAISHIETFTEQLSKDLSVLDGVMKSVLYYQIDIAN